MTRGSSHGPWIPLLALLGLLASRSRGDEPKIYRWVGEDGHVYTSTAPPPNGRGVIDAKSAPAKAMVVPAAEKPGEERAPSAAASRSRRPLLSPNAASAAAQRPASAGGDASNCARYQSWADQWRLATRSVAAAEASLDRLQSDTDDYVRRNDSYYERQVTSAEDRLTRAQDQLRQVEDDAGTAGVPQLCMSD